jgi:hypothetical protein
MFGDRSCRAQAGSIRRIRTRDQGTTVSFDIPQITIDAALISKAWNRGPRISAGFGVNISLSVLSNRFQTHARMIGNFYVFQRWAGTEKAGGAKALDP